MKLMTGLAVTAFLVALLLFVRQKYLQPPMPMTHPSVAMLKAAQARFEVASKTPGSEDDCEAAHALVMYLEEVAGVAVGSGEQTAEEAARAVAVWQGLKKDACKDAEEERRREIEDRHRDLFRR